MFEQTFAIIRNTFFESIRQPIMLVVLLVATLLIILSNPLSAFTMEDDQRMMIHMGLATVFTGGALLASFIATSVLTREIENKTALTVISKPVGRPVFVIGKFLGVSGAMLLGALYMAIVFLLVERHGVLQTVRDPVHQPVVTFGIAALALGLGIGVWCNYFYGTAFSSTVICATTPLIALAFGLSLMFRHDFTLQPIMFEITAKRHLYLALLCVIVAILVLTSIAVAASTRLGQVLTLVVTLGVFLAGMLSDWFFGRPIHRLEMLWLGRASDAGQTRFETKEQTIHLITGQIETTTTEIEVAIVPLASMAEGSEALTYWAANLGYSVIPNFQVLWLSDAVTQGHVVPIDYVFKSIGYGALYMLVALSAAVILFQRREVG